MFFSSVKSLKLLYMKKIFFPKNKTVDSLFPSSELQKIEMTTSGFLDLLTEDTILRKLNMK